MSVDLIVFSPKASSKEKGMRNPVSFTKTLICEKDAWNKKKNPLNCIFMAIGDLSGQIVL